MGLSARAEKNLRAQLAGAERRIAELEAQSGALHIERDDACAAIEWLLEEYVPPAHQEGASVICEARECGGCLETDEPCDDYKAAVRAGKRLTPALMPLSQRHLHDYGKATAEVIKAAEALVNSFCSGLDGVGPCDRRCSGWITCYTLKQLRAAVDKMQNRPNNASEENGLDGLKSTKR